MAGRGEVSGTGDEDNLRRRHRLLRRGFARRWRKRIALADHAE